MSKTVELSKAQISTILSCINEREALYLKEIEVNKDKKEQVLMVKGWKKKLIVIEELQRLFGYSRLSVPGRK
ncbi:MAG: hypothetical protein WCK09_00280 [Bacteroidota bacterium]